ncbi:inactive carboxypeptidase-like protein X2 [Styela clava]
MPHKSFVVLWCCVVIIPAVLGDIPNVYEFCSALMTDKTASSHSCADQCQGRPGKRGPEGRRGLPGVKGDRGQEGTTESLEDKIRLLEEKMKKTVDIIPKLSYCGLGMKNRDIPDHAITASSDYDYRHAAHHERMDENAVFHTASTGFSIGAWCPTHDTNHPWIQVDFQRPRFIGGIVTQGRPIKYGWDHNQWVKTYKVACGNSTSTLRTITDNSVDKVFVGNTDEDSKVINMFPKPLICRLIRLYPLSWNNHPCMRMEVIRGECHDMF